MMDWIWGRRSRDPNDNPEVKASRRKRDELRVIADEAVKETDRVTDDLIADYEQAEAQMLANGRAKRKKR